MSLLRGNHHLCQGGQDQQRSLQEGAAGAGRVLAGPASPRRLPRHAWDSPRGGGSACSSHTHTHTRGAALPSAVPHQRRCLSLSAPRGDTGAGGAPLAPLAPLAPRLPDKRLLFRARAPTAPPEARAQPPAFQPQETSLLPADPSLNITALRNQCKSHPCVLELFAEPGQACPHGPVSWRAPRPAR